MRLGLSLGLQRSFSDPAPLAAEAERLGFHSVWVPEAWGTDAVSLLGWLAARTERIGIGSAILQIPARTPAMTAMTAATLDGLSGGRFRLGLGMSGPQVVEGWHGVPYGRPLGKTREFVEIVRTILKREAPLRHHGPHYEIPMAEGTGLGKPLKLMLPPRRSDIPIYLAAIGPGNTALAAEIADGWLPIFFSPFHRSSFDEPLRLGGAKRAADRDELDIAPTVGIAIGEDLQSCLDTHKPNLALYIGGMGARGKNFYFDLASRYGYESEAKAIQDAFLAGRKRDAAAAVPNELVDEVTLSGPKSRVAERLEVWKQAGVRTLICSTNKAHELQALAEVVT